MKLGVTIKVFGNFYAALFIGLVTSLVSPLICYDHPDGVNSSLAMAPHVLCDSDEANSVYILVVFSLMFVAGFLVFLAVIIWRAPMVSLADPDYKDIYGFLLDKYSASHWWFGYI